MKQILFFILTICILKAKGQAPSFDTPQWQEIKKEIGNSSIVGLGEIGHGFESINQTKSVFVDFLHTELNFQAVMFESSFTESVIGFLSNDFLENRLKNFLYPFWNTTSVKTALKGFFNDEKHTALPLIIGFDIQEDCRFQRLSEYLNTKKLITTNKEKLNECDSILSFYIGKNFSRKGAITNPEYLILLRNYELIAGELKAQNLDTLKQKLLQRSIENRKWLCKYLTFLSVTQKMYYRDSLMADNIKWLKNNMYAKNKLIIWAANTHISKVTKSKQPKWMGEWLSYVYLEKYFSISFQKGQSIGNDISAGNTSFKYFNKPNQKFDLIIYLEKLQKIQSQEWLTPCN
jgi:erythromycin esterase